MVQSIISGFAVSAADEAEIIVYLETFDGEASITGYANIFRGEFVTEDGNRFIKLSPDNIEKIEALISAGGDFNSGTRARIGSGTNEAYLLRSGKTYKTSFEMIYNDGGELKKTVPLSVFGSKTAI